MLITLSLHRAYLLLAVMGLVICPAASFASCEDDVDSLGLLNAFQVISATAARAPKPLSQTAENVTVITRTEIESLNAHTLADVLDSIPGIQTQRNGGVGGLTYTYIQSASPFHQLVMIDGVPLDNVNNDADTGNIPARIIERIEIVKGSASSSWGKALGGVINVITKSPVGSRTISGAVDASLGERTTSTAGATLAGTSGSIGYLLSGGWLGSNGLLPNSALDSNYIYSKLVYGLPSRGRLTGTIHYSRTERGILHVPAVDLNGTMDASYLYATFQLQRPLGNRLELEVDGHYANRDIDLTDKRISDNSPFNVLRDREYARGLAAKLIWHGDNNLLVAGSEYVHEEFKMMDRFDLTDPLRNHHTKFDRYGVFLNDTITIGAVSVTPGGRYDSVATGDQFSPSIGATWQVTENTLLRGYTARGFSSPIHVAEWGVAKVWSSQVGIESMAVPRLWLKGTLFRNETWNATDIFNRDTKIPERRIALGSELEVRTVPVWNTSLGGGWTYTDTYRTGNGSTVYGLPRQTVQLSLRYDDKKYRGMLTGRHVWWNSNPTYQGRYFGLTWDLHLGAKLYKCEQNSMELFLSGHNLFNGAQYPDSYTPNTGRWFEGGMMVRF